MTGARTMAAGLAVVLAACGGSSDFANGDVGVDSEIITGADETSTASDELSGSVSVGTVLATTADLNMRRGAGMNFSVIRVIASGSRISAMRATPDGPWYYVRHQGVDGWCHGNYLRVVEAPPAPADSGSATPNNSANRDGAIARARAGVGFSYWWGHGRWQPGGPTSATRGSCTGTCPGCTHTGRYGADCSGYVAKIWRVQGATGALDQDQHPYSTWNFRYEKHGWHGINRADAQKADAFVFNQDGSGHMVLYEGGDPWGSMWAYEARGCSSGIVRNLRSLSSHFRGIARDGY